MGGRGASSGRSVKGIVYGAEYSTVYQSGNIKFLLSNDKNTKAPIETMTHGRVYATIDKNTNKLKSITYYDEGKRIKQIDLTHTHMINGNLEVPHTHKGYFHNEKGDFLPSSREQKMIDRVVKTWDYFNRRKK